MKKEMTIQQASQLTGYHEATLTRACQQGTIKARRAGRRWIVEVPSLLEFGQRRPHNAPRTKEQENQLELAEEPMEIPPIEALAEEWKEIQAEEENLIEETRSERHSEPTRWEDVLIATYEDLLLQYRRGFADGYNQAKLDAEAMKAEGTI